MPSWGSVGNVDLVIRAAERGAQLAWLAELKWCGQGRDVLHEAIWDMFKMALATTRTERPTAFLIAGAEAALWERSKFADLFDDGTHDPVELCERRLSDQKATLAWDDVLRGGYDRYPDQLPAAISSAVVGRAVVGHWELRAVQVSVAGTQWIAMAGGWPNGSRPDAARHPASD